MERLAHTKTHKSRFRIPNPTSTQTEKAAIFLIKISKLVLDFPSERQLLFRTDLFLHLLTTD